MEKSGITRRIDDLGRIVIPKEIRKNLRINDGDNIEIYINEEKIILQKYSDLKNIENIAQLVTDSIYSITKDIIIITDSEQIIAVSGHNKKELLHKNIDDKLISIIRNRDNNIFENIIEKINGKYIIKPILVNGDIKGSLILVTDNITKEKEQIINVNTIFLNKYLEE